MKKFLLFLLFVATPAIAASLYNDSKIQVKRGNYANIPASPSYGEFVFSKDTHRVFIGYSTGKRELAGIDSITFANLSTNGQVGMTSGKVAEGDHVHTLLKDSGGTTRLSISSNGNAVSQAKITQMSGSKTLTDNSATAVIKAELGSNTGASIVCEYAIWVGEGGGKRSGSLRFCSLQSLQRRRYGMDKCWTMLRVWRGID